MNKKQRALFLDRDGVINIDHKYVHECERFEFVDGVFELCRMAVHNELDIFVVTNQAGIGRGYYTEQDFLELTNWMCQVFEVNGSSIRKVYYCPFHPERGLGGYKRESVFRKPGPGMILQASREYGLDLPGSILIGDKDTDIQAGRAAGVGCNILYDPQHRWKDIKGLDACRIGRLVDAIPYLSRTCV